MISVVFVGGNLYAIGGRDNTGRILNTGECYDPGTNTWTAIAPMQHARVGFGLVVIDNKIYALGGSNDMSDPLVSGEEYNIYTDKYVRTSLFDKLNKLCINLIFCLCQCGFSSHTEWRQET